MTESVIILGGYDGPRTPIPVTGGGAGGATEVEGMAANGAAFTGNPVWSAGDDGTLVRSFRTDTTGRQVMVGAAADGAAVAGNPVLLAGQDGTNVQSLKVDTTGRPEVVGPSIVGAVPVGNPVYVAGDDGTNIRGMRLDTSGRTIIVGAAADGAAVTGNPVLTAGFDGTNAQTILTDTSGRHIIVGASVAAAAVAGNPVLIGADDASGNAQYIRSHNIASDAVTPQQPGLVANAQCFDFNGTDYDRHRNNNTATALASAARTTQTDSADFVNYNNRGLHAILSITVASGTGGLSVLIQGKDPVSGTYYSLNGVPTAITTTGIFVYELQQGTNGATSGNIAQTTSRQVPRTFRIRVQVGDGSSYTYSVGLAFLGA